MDVSQIFVACILAIIVNLFILTRPTKKQWRSQYVFSMIAVGSCRSQQACMQYSEMGLQLFFISRLLMVQCCIEKNSK